MKYALYAATLGLALWLGFSFGGLVRQRPTWWRMLVGASLIILGFLAFWVPTGGSFVAGDIVVSSRPDARIPLHIALSSGTEAGATTVEATHPGSSSPDNVVQIDLSALPDDQRSDLRAADDAIVLGTKSPDGSWRAVDLVSIEPLLTIPLIPALEERARNLYFHVPTAWVSSLAFMIACFFAFRLLRKRDPVDDTKAASVAAVGFLFCIVATATGSIWAKFNWGSFWNWDPRQVSIVVVLVVYGAYFALRSAIPEPEKRSRISAVYIIMTVLPVLFFVYGYPRMQPSLHPGGEGSGTIGPVVDPADIWLNPTKAGLFMLGFFAFTTLFFWMANLDVRRKLLEDRREEEERPAAAVTTGSLSTIGAIDDTTTRQEG